MFWIHGGGNFAGSTFDHVPTTDPPQLWFDGQCVRRAPRRGRGHDQLSPRPVRLLRASGARRTKTRRSATRACSISAWRCNGCTTTSRSSAATRATSRSSASRPARRTSAITSRRPAAAGCSIARSARAAVAPTGPMGGSREPSSADVADGMLAFTKAMGCDTAKDALACLREKPVQDILDNAHATQPDGGRQRPRRRSASAWSMDGPGGFLPESARDAVRQGRRRQGAVHPRQQQRRGHAVHVHDGRRRRTTTNTWQR